MVTIAVLVLALGWWFWPRVDQRFVGRWVRFLPHHNELGADFFEFDANGGGSRGSNNIDHMRFTWSVKGSYLTVNLGREPGLQGLLNRVQYAIVQARPHFEHGSQRFFVSTVTQDRIVWQPLSDTEMTPAEREETFDMRRVPR